MARTPSIVQQLYHRTRGEGHGNFARTHTFLHIRKKPLPQKQKVSWQYFSVSIRACICYSFIIIESIATQRNSAIRKGTFIRLCDKHGDNMKSTASIRTRQPDAKRTGYSYFKKNYEYYLLLLPALIYYLVFHYGPLYGLQIAFKSFNGALGIWGSRWVGLKHFRAFFGSYYFWPLIANTLGISVYSLVAGFPVPVLLALMLNEVRQASYKKFIQTIMYAPHFISTVVLVGILSVMLSPSYGIVNFARRFVGLEPFSYMTNAGAFRHIYVWSGIWQNTGWGAIIYLAALSNVPPELHEAAVIDGASRMQRLYYINIPTIVPTMVILLILNTGRLMSVGFEKVFLMQNDLNLDTSNVISTYIYQRGLLSADFSFSAAVGLFNNVINFVLLVCINFISKKIGDTSLF